MNKEYLNKLPGVDTLLNKNPVKHLVEEFGADLTKFIIRNYLNNIRCGDNGNSIPSDEEIINKIKEELKNLSRIKLKRIINATGIILHTNFGRAPLGNIIIEQITGAVSGYSNLEFDLESGRRSKRIDHIIELIKYLTGAEDAVVVNNNAAAVFLVNKVFAASKEVIISRGELIEIGGSFRLPEIISASGAKMVEVGTTNRTNINDYINAVTAETKILFKAHKSNFKISGFMEEVGIGSLVHLAKEKKLVLLYDIGSGLLNNDDSIFRGEPSVKESICKGVDLVTFSCDKLLGGPQAGIIAGKKGLIHRIANNPLMRTYRVDKITLAALAPVLTFHLNKNERDMKIPVYKMLNQSEDKLKEKAFLLSRILFEKNIASEVIPSHGYCGGGTMPAYELESYSVKLLNTSKEKNFAQKIYFNLMKLEIPVAAALRKGEIHFDVMTIDDDDIVTVAEAVKKVI